MPDIPAEYLLIENHRLGEINRWNLHVAETWAAQLREPARARGNLGSPFLRAHVSSMLCEEPVVAVQILNAILKVAVRSVVEILQNPGARRFRFW
jgi:hypothetical protein